MSDRAGVLFDVDGTLVDTTYLHAVCWHEALRQVWDGQAAGRAGLRFVALTCGGTSAAELVDSGAVEVWRDPADLLAHTAESVLAELRR